MQSVELATLFQPEHVYEAELLNTELPYSFPEFPREQDVYLYSIMCENKTRVYMKYLFCFVALLLNSKPSAQL